MNLGTLLAASDVVTLHVPLTPDNHRMIDAHALSLMKEDTVLVNIGRGGLIDTDALAETLESGKLRNVALDTLEKEDVLYYVKRVGNVIANCQMAILRSFPNVILTPHNAFYTAVDVRQMTETSMEGAWALLNNLDSPHRPEVGGATPLTTLFGALRTPVRIGSARLTRGVSSK